MTLLPPSYRQRAIQALLPVALRHWPERQAETIANKSVTDLILVGRTLLLPAGEVDAAMACVWSQGEMLEAAE